MDRWLQEWTNEVMRDWGKEEGESRSARPMSELVIRAIAEYRAPAWTQSPRR
ncbi:MAG: hypothetical protein QGF28_01230 [Candidatus Thalassarchaeaceae archaeon]|jgi:hypothetical protein|nr:hypothetical protein [Candidatus Thalassarchaeaceae archaeon]MDP7256958.1 hypothetical protein [Candidatus Thalassarchaeaceae archaeon]MDP7445816.1 hypothetical protein [Candidatus Thalassarchaeaceae archaeon]MDP7649677.1 hypothetical protein [Candidatus Thalassarchaeaceae archaeon]HJL54758.1 hypothetical protein [Candidatus Thalassarchaeaceae archaeon]